MLLRQGALLNEADSIRYNKKETVDTVNILDSQRNSEASIINLPLPDSPVWNGPVPPQKHASQHFYVQ